MSRESAEIVAARLEVERRRARLIDTARELQVRLSPQALAHGAWEGVKGKGADLAEDAVDAVRARPLAATGVVAALALFLAREPLMDLAGKLADGVKDKRAGKRSRKASRDKKQETRTETVE